MLNKDIFKNINLIVKERAHNLYNLEVLKIINFKFI